MAPTSPYGVAHNGGFCDGKSPLSLARIAKMDLKVAPCLTLLRLERRIDAGN
jgi:hypothetical protein